MTTGLYTWWMLDKCLLNISKLKWPSFLHGGLSPKILFFQLRLVFFDTLMPNYLQNPIWKSFLAFIIALERKCKLSPIALNLSQLYWWASRSITEYFCESLGSGQSFENERILDYIGQLLILHFRNRNLGKITLKVIRFDLKLKPPILSFVLFPLHSLSYKDSLWGKSILPQWYIHSVSTY